MRWRQGRPRTWREFVQLADDDESVAQREWQQSEPVDYKAVERDIEADP